ncbi:MAG: hypothetical protein RIS69_1640, partial [Actinomycetota bacterium]
FKIAAVGTATAEAVGGADLIPNVQTGRSLGESFATGQGRILLAVAESAGTDFEVAARGKGWTVDRVTTYRTVSITPTHDRSGDISQADAITFASASSAKQMPLLLRRLHRLAPGTMFLVSRCPKLWLRWGR